MKKTPVWFTRLQKDQLIEFLELYSTEFNRKFKNYPDSIIDALVRGEIIKRKRH